MKPHSKFLVLRRALLANLCLIAASAANADGAGSEPDAHFETAKKSTFVYISYIKTSPDMLWKALTTNSSIKQIWAGAIIESDWKAGAPWKLMLPGGRVADAGEIVEVDPPRHLVLKWRNEINPERKAEGYSRCTYDIEQSAGATKITVTHEISGESSKFIGNVSNGWPIVISNVKSLLETGSVATTTTDR